MSWYEFRRGAALSGDIPMEVVGADDDDDDDDDIQIPELGARGSASPQGVASSNRPEIPDLK